MLKVNHRTLVILSGLIWLVMGVFLFKLGFKLLGGAFDYIDKGTLPASYPLLKKSSDFFGSLQAGITNGIVILTAISLFIGFLKGKKVLGKTALKAIARITAFPNPTNLTNLYSGRYYILLAGMMGLGISMNVLGIPHDIRGTIDIIIGSALINGSVVYFRHALSMQSAVQA
jgi:hypothetical protein